MMKVHDPPKLATASAMVSPNVDSRFDHFVGIAGGAIAYELLRGVKLASQDGEHVHAGVRFLLQECEMSFRSTLRQVVSSTAIALVWCGVWSSIEAMPKNSPRTWFIDHHVLMILVDGGHPHRAGNHDVGLISRIVDLVDPLAGSKVRELHLLGEHCHFFVVEQREQWYLSEDL